MSAGVVFKRLAAVAVCLGLVGLLILGCSPRARPAIRGTPAVTAGQEGAQPQEPKAGEERVNPKDGATMVYVPSGEFIMGSDGGSNDEKPQRKVYLDGYWIYKYEVTVAQYRKFCEATGRQMPNAPSRGGWKDDHPVVNVSWDGAAAYAQWARVRLPTEAEWEKAARGTDGRTYPWGNERDNTKCNNTETGPKQTMPVGSFPAGVSPYGAHDMAGNVFESCQDWYDGAYYAKAPTRTPPGPPTGQCRVLRGGSWDLNPDFMRCADRHWNYPVHWGISYGFRCACSDG